MNVEGDGEWVEIRVHWAGGQQTYSRIRRPVAGTSQLSRWSELKTRLQELKSEGLVAGKIADQLHREGFKPAKGARITAQIVRIWLSRHGLSNSRKQLAVETTANEWTIPQIVDRYQIPVGTVHSWIRRGQVQARQIGGHGGRWIVNSHTGRARRTREQPKKSPIFGRSREQRSSTSHEENCFKGCSVSQSAR